jgi:hypothetical protein
MFSNAIESKNAMDENTKHGSTQKFGTIMMIGTGGDMSSNGGTYDAHRMFYDPDTYDILAFNDE